MANPSSICFLLTSLGHGGAETVAVDFAIHLTKRGWKVQFVTMVADHAEPLVIKLKSAKIELTSLKMRPGIPNPVSIFKLAKLLRKQQPYILHCHMVHANLLGRLVRLITPVPVVISTAHSIDEGNRVLELAYRWTDPLADITTHVSQTALDKYVEKGLTPHNKIRFIPNGLNTTLLTPNPQTRQKVRTELNINDHFVWLAVGKMADAKDYPNLISAFEKLDFTKKVKLLIAGHGPQEALIKKQILEYGLTEHIQCLGIRNDIPDLMNAADAYVMSSAWEGMPMVLLEASSLSLPIAATDVGGNHEVVIDGKTGFLAPPQNPQELSIVMNKIMSLSSVSYKALGRAGRIHTVKEYDIEQVLDRWEALYTKLGPI